MQAALWCQSRVRGMPGHGADGREPDTEEATEAIIEGDLGFRRGTAQAALRNRDFRIFWGGTFASNIGTWMQNVLLGAFGYELTGSAVFVGILFFAQRSEEHTSELQ